MALVELMENLTLPILRTLVPMPYTWGGGGGGSNHPDLTQPLTSEHEILQAIRGTLIKVPENIKLAKYDSFCFHRKLLC